LSLAGIPPLSGFFAKLALIQAGFDEGDYLIIALAILVGFLTLYSMSKIWNEAFAKPAPDATAVTSTRVLPLQVGPIVVLAGLTVAIGLAAGPLLDLSTRAADSDEVYSSYADRRLIPCLFPLGAPAL
jgi:multicomponent Na+:H+ antiporter subunit D